MARVSTGPGSKQDYRTPQVLFDQIKKHFDLVVDLAAHEENHKCPLWLGPGGIHEDSLKSDWTEPFQLSGEWWWLNPPYADIGPWYAKCKHAMEAGKRIVSLVPMDAADWMTDNVPGHAGIWHLKGRVKFDGADQSGSKDCALHIWHPHHVGTFRVWDWKADRFLV